jgi:hypothetical protein
MPEFLAVIPLLVGAAGVGTSVYSATQGGGGAKPTATPAPTPAEALKTKQNQEASLSSAFPGIQAATGGSLSPEAWIRLSELLSGKAGEAGIGAAEQDLIKKFSVGVGGGGTGGSTGGGLTPTGSSFT